MHIKFFNPNSITFSYSSAFPACLYGCAVFSTCDKSVNPLLCPIWDPVFPSWYGIGFFPSAQTGQEQVLICMLEISDNALHCRIVASCLRNSVSFVLPCPSRILAPCCLPRQDEFSVWDMYKPRLLSESIMGCLSYTGDGLSPLPGIRTAAQLAVEMFICISSQFLFHEIVFCTNLYKKMWIVFSVTSNAARLCPSNL